MIVAGTRRGSHGDCINDQCVCTVEWEGEDCMTPTSIDQTCRAHKTAQSDCEHAVDCEQYELWYWVPIWHKEALTTDRLYSWVTPDTGKNFQYEAQRGEGPWAAQCQWMTKTTVNKLESATSVVLRGVLGNALTRYTE